MADKLDWLNQHYVLLSHEKVSDVVLQNKYKVPFEFAQSVQQYEKATDFMRFLESQDKLKPACEFLSYNMHRRALAWWGYCCVLNLRAELKAFPYVPRRIEDIAKPKEMEPPEWAKMPQMPMDKIKSLSDLENIPEYRKIKEQLLSTKAMLEEELKKCPPKIVERYRKSKEQVFAQFKEQVGMDPMELVQHYTQKLDEALKNPEPSYKDSVIYKEKIKLKEQLEAMRQDTIRKIRQVLPEPDPKELVIGKENALNAAFSYIMAPNDTTAKNCLEMGNVCPDVPEGLLCLVCFWSYGNMMPDPQNSSPVVMTPPGLASNGFNSLLLMCLLAQGGQRKFEERLQTFYRIGKQVAYGANNWALFADYRVMPHFDEASDRFEGILSDDEIDDAAKRVLKSSEENQGVYRALAQNESEAAKEPSEKSGDEPSKPVFLRFK